MELFNLVNRLRDRIREFGDLLRGSEALTRYALIDPVLRALGWDTEDPSIVRPEEPQGIGRPDYILYLDGKKLIALEAKKLGTRLDEQRALDLGFKYSWKFRIPYFIITDGNSWRVYDVSKMGGKSILEINIFEEPVEEVVRKLLSLWKPLVKHEIKPVKKVIQLLLPTSKEEKAVKEPERSIKQEEKALDPDKVREFYERLTYKEKVMLEIVYEYWKKGHKPSKDEIIAEMRRRGVDIDRRGFTGVKSGITRLSKKMGLPAPMPTEPELGDKWRYERERYKLKDEWGYALEKILEKH